MVVRISDRCMTTLQMVEWTSGSFRDGTGVSVHSASSHFRKQVDKIMVNHMQEDCYVNDIHA